MGCEFFELSFAQKIYPLTTNLNSLPMHIRFLEILHKGDYHHISKPMSFLKASYLQDPHYVKFASHIRFIHAWKLSERQRLDKIPPQIRDDAILARKVFSEAVKLDPKNTRYLGFHSSMLMT